MRSNYDQAKFCLELADEAMNRGNTVSATYYLARAQVYATLAVAEHGA